MREDGVQYEQYCCKYLNQEGYSTEMTIASGDQGVDIIAKKNDVRFAIQCKYRSDGMIGNEAIQQVAAGKDYYDCDIAVVMTNRTFTPKAIELAQKLRVKMWGCIDFPELNQQANNQPIENVGLKENEMVCNAAKSNAIGNASTVLSEIDEACAVLEKFMSNRFRIRKHATRNEEFDDEYDDDFDDEEEENPIHERKLFNEFNLRMESLGMQKAKEICLLLEGITGYHFEVFDYSYSEGRNLNRFAYISENGRVIENNVINKIKQNIPFKVVEVISEIGILILTVSSANTEESNLSVPDFIRSFVLDNVSVSAISISDEVIINIDFVNYTKDKSNSTNKYHVYSSELIEETVLLDLKEEITKKYGFDCAVKQINRHSFDVDLINKESELDEIRIIDVSNILDMNFSQYIRVLLKQNDESIELVTRLLPLSLDDCPCELSDPNSQVALYITENYAMLLSELLSISLYKNRIIQTKDINLVDGTLSVSPTASVFTKRIEDSKGLLISIVQDDMVHFPIRYYSYEDVIDVADYGNYFFFCNNVMLFQKNVESNASFLQAYNKEEVLDEIKTRMNSFILSFKEFFPTFEENIRFLLSEKNSIVISRKIAMDRYNINVDPVDSENKTMNIISVPAFLGRDIDYWLMNYQENNRNSMWGNHLFFDYDYSYFGPDFAEARDIVLRVFENEGICYESYRTMMVKFETSGEIVFSFVDSEINPFYLTRILNEKIDDSSGAFFVYKRSDSEIAVIYHRYITNFVNSFASMGDIRHSLSKKRSGLEEELSNIEMMFFDECVFKFLTIRKLREENIESIFVSFNSLRVDDIKDYISDQNERLNYIWGLWSDVVQSFVRISFIISCLNLDNYDFLQSVIIEDCNGVRMADIVNGVLFYSFPVSFDASVEFESSYYEISSSMEVEGYSSRISEMVKYVLNRGVELLNQLN